MWVYKPCNCYKMHWQQRKRYGTLFADAPPHLTLYRLYAPEETEQLLNEAPTLSY